VNKDSGEGEVFIHLAPESIIHISPESLFTSLRNDYSHAPEYAIVRMGKTFSYGPQGPRGLLGNKKLIVITARGGAYAKGTPTEGFDFQEPYLRHIFGFIGLTDVTFIHAEKQSSEEADLSFAAAAEQIGRLAAQQTHEVAW
jgi:FMN-dependent NADH-azoreductase